MNKSVIQFDTVIFYSNDIEQVIDFYSNSIGLEVDSVEGDKYVSFVLANGAKLGIKRAVKARELPGAQSVILSIDNIEEAYRELISKDCIFYKELTKESWGRTFSVLDPDDNKVQFVERMHD